MSSERKDKTRKSQKISRQLKRKTNKVIQASKNLREFNPVLSGIIESTSAYIFSVDLKYRYINFNTNHARLMKAIYGVKIEIGKSILGYMSVEEDRKKARKNLDRALAGEQFIEESYSGDRLKSRRFFQVSHGPIKTNDGKITGVVVWANDITERRRSEEALSESEERYRQLVNLSPDAIYVHSEGKIVFANPASFKLIRAKKESDLIGKKAMDFVHLDYYRSAEERIRSAMRLSTIAPLIEEKFICVDGTPIDVEVTAKPLKYAGKPAMQVIARDITERKQAENSLYESETNLRTFIESLPDAVFFKDGNGRWLTINTAARKLFRLMGKEYVGKTDTELALIVPELKEAFEYCKVSDEATWKSGKLERSEEFVPDEQGIIHFFDTIKVPLFNDDGSRKGLVIIGRDITEKRKIGEELKQSEAKFRSFVEESSEGFTLVDEHGFILEWNRAREKMTGLKASQVIGEPYWDIMQQLLLPELKTSERYKRNKREILNALRTGESPLFNSSIEAQVVNSAGEHRFVRQTIFPIKTNLGFRIGSVTSDITEKKNAENSIIESERRFKDLANLLPQTIFEADQNGIITFANDAALATFGYTAENVSKELNMINIVAEKDRGRALDNMNRILRHQKTSDNEYEMLRKDGTTFPALAFNSPIICEGKSVGFRGSIVDISYQKHAENELRKLSEAVSQSPASIIITNLNGDIEYVNKTFEDNTGYFLDEVYHKNPRFLQSGNTPKEEYKVMWETLLSGKTWRGELSNKKKNGELYWEDALISPVRDIQGNSINYLAVKQDITEKKKMIQDLIEAKEEAEKANKLKSEFLAQISHEIRSPLNVVMSMAALMKEDFPNEISEEQLRYFSGIESAGKRIIRTVDLILDISELQVGTYKPDFQRIDLVNDVLKAIQKEYLKQATEKGLSLIVLCDKGIHSIVADHYSVNQIFVNLIDNAIKYTYHGAVTITVKKNIKKQTLVEVEDTGIGVSPEYLREIFEPFTQEDKGYSRRFEGNGLGLALVRRYCELNNAEISVESVKGIGSKFTVTFSKSN